MSTAIPPAVSRAVLERDGYQCVVCGTMNGLELHHWREFRSAGGSDTEENLVTLCWRCHARTQLHEIEVVLKQVEGRLVAFIKGRIVT